MHHNKPSSAVLIKSMEDGDVRDHELLDLMSVVSGLFFNLKMT
jgi:hypothetical protein